MQYEWTTKYYTTTNDATTNIKTTNDATTNYTTPLMSHQTLMTTAPQYPLQQPIQYMTGLKQITSTEHTSNYQYANQVRSRQENNRIKVTSPLSAVDENI
ncbi:MAG: hypothetical protein ACEY3E_01370 [Candidatus Tisiphia sp.]